MKAVDPAMVKAALRWPQPEAKTAQIAMEVSNNLFIFSSFF
jgi:hypothetical protein